MMLMTDSPSPSVRYWLSFADLLYSDTYLFSLNNEFIHYTTVHLLHNVLMFYLSLSANMKSLQDEIQIIFFND